MRKRLRTILLAVMIFLCAVLLFGIGHTVGTVNGIRKTNSDLSMRSEAWFCVRVLEKHTKHEDLICSNSISKRDFTCVTTAMQIANDDNFELINCPNIIGFEVKQ